MKSKPLFWEVQKYSKRIKVQGVSKLEGSQKQENRSVPSLPGQPIGIKFYKAGRGLENYDWIGP
jgi:hypothetical protein